jgi:hypothetical protein
MSELLFAQPFQLGILFFELGFLLTKVGFAGAGSLIAACAITKTKRGEKTVSNSARKAV